MKNENVKSFTVLTVICVAVAALMGIVNYFTAPVIEQNEKNKVTEALLVVMPDGEAFEELDVEGLPATIKQVYTEKNGGYVFKLVTSGYSSGLTLMCGVAADGSITGAEYVSGSETLGKEKTYGSLFEGKTKHDINTVDTISGATLTTLAYKNAIADALDAFEILTGGVE